MSLVTLPVAPAAWHRALALCVLALATLLAGCATGPMRTERDPLEPLNRQIYAFNEEADRLVVAPVAAAYRQTVPDRVRTGINNVFANLVDGRSALYNVLQLRLDAAADNFLRFAVNSVFGIAGVLDVASDAGLERRPTDFGSTLARWGVPAGPYVVLPLLGPSTVRDTAGLVVDRRADLLREVVSEADRNVLSVVRLVDLRSNLLRATDLIEGVALDKYSFVRDAYLQRRGVVLEDPPPPEPADAVQNPPR